MNVSNIKLDQINNKIVDKILFEGLEYNNSSADCILVLGSSSAVKYRVPKAVDLFNNHKSMKLLFSGGRTLDIDGDRISEAQYMRRRAIDLGVPDEAIILDELSYTTKENMICSQIELERSFKLNKINKIILVTTAYHMRRSLLMARMYFPNWIEIIPCPADDTNTKRINWFSNEAGYSRAIGEVGKIISYIQEGAIVDFAISN